MSIKENPPNNKILVPISIIDDLLPNGVTFADAGISLPGDWVSGDGTVFIVLTQLQVRVLLDYSK